MNKSPDQSPLRQETTSPKKEAPFTNPFGFPLRSLLRDAAERPIPPPPTAELIEAPLPIPETNTEPSFPLSNQNESASKSPERSPAANRMEASAAAAVAARVGGEGEKRMRVESGVLRRVGAEWGLRVLEVVLCVVSFSVMAADKTSGWAGDSFDRYQEFRYCVSMNVIAFVYAVFQVYARFHRRVMRRRIVDRPLSYYLDFTLDQVLAYLLMSASSSAAARNDDWISMFGNDEFTNKMKASIAMSFLAFFAFALSSIISANKLFSWKL